MPVSTTMNAASPTPGAGYFVNRFVDPVVISGVSLGVYLLYRLVPTVPAMSMLPTLILVGTWGVSYPHFASTSYRLYGSRINRQQYPFTAYLVPVVIGAVILASFASPSIVAPGLIKLFQLWSPYHFSGQTLGITLVFARRFNFSMHRSFRRALTTFILSTSLLHSAWRDTATHDSRFFGVTYPSLHIATWVPWVFQASLVMSGAALIFFAVQHWRDSGVSVPLMVALPSLTQFVWFVAPHGRPYADLVPFFHSLQYLLLAWIVHLSQASSRSGGSPSRRLVFSRTSKWMIANILGGYVMFWLLPRVGVQFGRSLMFSSAVVLSALQLHHFFVDGVIWKLRNPGVRSPLSTSLAVLSGRRRQLESVPS